MASRRELSADTTWGEHFLAGFPMFLQTGEKLWGQGWRWAILLHGYIDGKNTYSCLTALYCEGSIPTVACIKQIFKYCN